MQQKISLFLIDLALILLTVSAKPFYFYQKIPRVIHKIEIKIHCCPIKKEAKLMASKIIVI